MAKINQFCLTKIVLYVPMAKSGRAENLLDVLARYIILDFVDWIKYAEISLLENLGYHDRKPNIREW